MNNDSLISSDEKEPLFSSPSSRDTHDLPKVKRSKSILKSIYFTLVASLGGLSFGLTVVFSSPLLDNLADSNLTQWREGFAEDCAYEVLIGPITPIAAIVGGLLSAPLTAVTGLVTGMIFTAAVYLGGWIMLGCSYFIASPYAFRGALLTGRALTGFAMGFSAASVPVYIAEIAPASIRGMLSGLFQMAVVTGGLFSYLLGGLVNYYWQASFVFAAIALLHALLLLSIRKSPVRSRNPCTNLRKLTMRTGGYDVGDGSVSPGSRIGYLWRIMLVVMIMTFQQVSGVNAIVFYAGPILQSTGWNNPVITADLAASLSIGVVQFLPTLLSIFLVDRFGRRILLFFGSLGLVLANLGMVLYFTLSFGFLPSNTVSNSTSGCIVGGLPSSQTARDLEALPLISIGIFFIAFSLSWGPIAWTFTAEILPLKIRTLGSSIGVATNWIWVSVVTLVFPIMSTNLGYSIPFCIFALLALLSAICVVFFMPETKGLTLNQNNSLRYSVRQNIREFAGLLKWCFYCRCFSKEKKTANPRDRGRPSHLN